MAEILNEWAYRQARSSLRKTASRSKAAELAAEAASYEALRSSGGLSLEIASLADLGGALVKARVARRWTQARLAQALGMPKQQIQRYEATAYACASLDRIVQIADALGLRFTGTASSGLPPEEAASAARMLAGFAAAEAFQAAEKRIRLRRLTAAEARRIYDDLCETYDRLNAVHSTVPAGPQDMAQRLKVRRAIGRLAQVRARPR